jgi:LPS-assembly protein
MKTNVLCYLLLFSSLAGLLAAQAEHEKPIIYADHKSIGEETLRADGHVEVLWQDYVIYADAIDFNLKSRELFAQGRVTMAAKDMVLSGEKLVFNLKTQKGELTDTYGMVSPTVRYETDRLTQADADTLTFRRLHFTSCAQAFPRWDITSRKGKIKKNSYIEMSSVLMRIKNVPFLFLPYLRYPLQKDGRATGILIPGFGNSSLRGFFVQNAFFWAIKPNIDLTLGADYFSKLGLGFSNELRYLFHSAKGSARVYYFKYLKDNEVYGNSANDYYVEADHKQDLPFLDTRLVLNVNRQSRPGFLRLLENDFDRALATNFQSSVSLDSSLSNMSVSLRASRQETYYVFADSSRVLEYMPSLAFNLNQQKLWKLPGYLSLAVNYQDVRRGGVTYEEEPVFETGVTSQRLTVSPSYELPLLKLPWLNSSLQLATNNSFYAKSRDPKSKKIIDEPLYLKFHTIKFSLQGPVFFRIFDLPHGKLKHVITPEIEFRYATREEDRDRLIAVDYFDYPSYSFVRFSLTTRLLAKSGDGSQGINDMLMYTIAQEYYFDPAEASQYRKINGEYPEFSELTNGLRLRPAADMSFDASLSYNYYIHGLSRLNVSFAYQPSARPLSGRLSFSINRNPYAAKNYVFNRSVISGDLRVQLPRFPLKLQAGVDYDFTDKIFRHGAVNLSFDYQCLVFSTEFKIFTYMGRSETQFRFGVSLGNLGMVSDFFGGK